MTESQWLKAADGDAMLAAVADRMSPRKWTLLAYGVLRRVWDILPPGIFHEAGMWMESNADEPQTDEGRRLWGFRLNDAELETITQVEGKQREIVRACDPDADAEAFREESERRVNPAVPLYLAASRAASSSIAAAGRAAQHAIDAVRLLATEAGPVLMHLRRLVLDAQEAWAFAGIDASLGLEYLAKANAMADKGDVRNPRVELSRAREVVGRLQENAENRLDAVQSQKEKADRRALGKLLLEQLGNPFRPYSFDPRWRTEPVVGLARAIDVDRAFERYPILFDALLEAGCDEEPILDHVRSTDPHAVGCWVIDLILQKDEPLFALPPLTPTRATGPGAPLSLADAPVI